MKDDHIEKLKITRAKHEPNFSEQAQQAILIQDLRMETAEQKGSGPLTKIAVNVNVADLA